MTAGRDGPLTTMRREPIVTVHGTFVVHRFHNWSTGAQPLAITRGDVTGAAPVTARVHSSCFTSEGLGACDCDCAEQLDAALEQIADAERGVLFYLMQEGRGAGFVAKALDRMLVQASGNRLTTFDAYAQLGLPPDLRTYSEVAGMSRLLGIEAPLRLLSNNPEKACALQDAGTVIAETAPLQIEPSAYSQHYLAAKQRAGHLLISRADVAPVFPPESVPLLDATPLANASHLVRVAAYLLPIGRDATAWFRLHVYLDAISHGVRIVLTYGDTGGRRVLVRIQREQLLDHFGLVRPRFRKRWDDAVARMVAHGHGIVVIAEATDTLRDDVLAPLLHTHLGDREGVILALSVDEAGDTAQLDRVLVPAAIRAA